MTLYRYLMGVSILYMQLAMALFFLNLKEINKAEQFTQNVYETVRLLKTKHCIPISSNYIADRPFFLNPLDFRLQKLNQNRIQSVSSVKIFVVIIAIYSKQSSLLENNSNFYNKL